MKIAYPSLILSAIAACAAPAPGKAIAEAGSTVNFLIMGDWGSGRPEQQTVADSMQQVAVQTNARIGTKKLAIIFIDTDLLNYGYSGDDLPAIYENFKAHGWTPENNTVQKQLNIIEGLLKKHADKEYLLVAGHHGIAVCEALNYLSDVQTLFEQYKPTAYAYGHVHSLAFGRSGSTAYVQSGCGGQSSGVCFNSVDDAWSESTFGFVSASFDDDSVTFNYFDLNGNAVHSATAAPRF
ncbi:hypothetical protein BDK51DRAFT_31661 [Blyttiomyces helicus]|uniref:Metallo-dependent phosphatase-like protein n=1 Tax=Blyttiomyces helicus TaxID=388810 RepID=A0A4P9W3K1_9FUNG|nr:hypothetical protein BDK51DRAFT_31661 [Blyttiomyces helicus]|eukprot:RKO86714.1 hypothetical protein BDK51DRAFT_31661 [Blyttiomyces helicus]